MVRTCAPCASDVGMMDPGRCNLQEKFFQRPYPAVRDLWYRPRVCKTVFIVGGFQAEMGKRVGWNLFFLDERDGLV